MPRVKAERTETKVGMVRAFDFFIVIKKTFTEYESTE